MKFPTLVRGWYLAGRSSDLTTRPVSLDLGGEELVLFRTEEGRASALPARCPHLGATLARGQVRGDRIQCAFHGWEFDAATGECRHVPSLPAPPALSLTPRVVEERHGLVFLHRGGGPAHPLPHFEDWERGELVASAPIRLRAECPWYMVSANGFDVVHLGVVHQRVPISPPVVDHPHPGACRIIHHYSVGGSSWQDRALRLMAGPSTRLSFTSWGGTLMLSRTDAGRRPVHLLSAVRPVGPDECEVDVVVFHPASTPVPMRLFRRWLVGRFFQHETRTLRQVRYSEATRVGSDEILHGYLSWLHREVTGAPC
jgi:nitrite reductase/ring-hydroxylating ferredoxin subunit